MSKTVAKLSSSLRLQLGRCNPQAAAQRSLDGVRSRLSC